MGNSHSSIRGGQGGSGRRSAGSNSRRESNVINNRASNARRSQQLSGSNSGSSSQVHTRSIDFSSQRSRPTTARSRLSQGFTGNVGSSSFKDQHHMYQQSHPYSLQSSAPASDSRVSLLSMVAGPREDSLPVEHAETTRLSLGPTVKPTKSSRALSSHHPASQLSGRPRSRTQSSEQGIVTVFSGIQKPPPLDQDLEALNSIPKYRPLVLAPSNNRLTGLFQSGTRYVEPSAEQLNLDETELTGFCFSFRDYVSDRVRRVCDRQSDLVTSAKNLGTRCTGSSTRLSYVSQLAKQDREGAAMLKSLQRQAEKSYELMQEILHDLERLEAALPASERFFGSNSAAPKAFPRLSKMLGQRRRHSLPAASPTSSVILRRQIASKKAGIPTFAQKAPMSVRHARSTSIAHSAATAGDVPRSARSPSSSLVHRASPSLASKSHSKYVPDALSLRRRPSRSSMSSSDLAISSRSSSPNLTAEPRLSFDGSNFSAYASTAPQVLPRLSHRRTVHPYNSARRPNSVASTFVDTVYFHGRSEPSLSSEQVMWSPQLATGASSSSFANIGPACSPQGSLPANAESNCPASDRGLISSADEGEGVHTEEMDRDHLYQSTMPMPVSTNYALHGQESETAGLQRCGEEGDSQRDDCAHIDKYGAVHGNLTPIALASVPNADQPTNHNRTPSSSKKLQPRRSLQQSVVTATSPTSLPRELSIRSGTSLASSPSTASIILHSPLSSPAAHVTTNALTVMASSEAPRSNWAPGSSQLPSEATRMLRQVMMEQSDSTSLKSPASSRPVSQNLSPDKARHVLTSNGGRHESVGDAFVDAGHAVAGTVARPRASSIAHSLISMVEEGDAAEQPKVLLSDMLAGGHASSDVASEIRPSVRTNSERMSTWSSSSARTLAEGTYSFRVPSVDEPHIAKQAPVSTALTTLTASAAMVNSRPPSRDKCGSVSSATGVSYFSARIPRARPVIDLGLAIRSDLERRVRSFSESETNPSLPSDCRPHSSMGFHETVSGATIHTTRPDSIHARRHSPHSASLRYSRPDKFQRHRLSMMSTGSQSSSRHVSTSSGRIAIESACSQPNATTTTSSTGQTTDKFPPPTPPAFGQTTANAAVNKRRAHTMGPPKQLHRPASGISK